MPDRLTKAEYRTQWMKAQEEVASLLYQATQLARLMPALYEGVTGEEAPDFKPTFQWDDEEGRRTG